MDDQDEPVHLNPPQTLPLPVSEGIPSGARRVGFLAGLLLVPAAIAAFGFGGWNAVAGTVVGGALALVNFWLLSRMVVATTASEDLSAGFLVLRLLGKLGLVGAILALVVLGTGLDVMGLLLGLTVVVAAVPLNLFVDWIAGAR